MLIYEYQAREFFEKRGVPVPLGYLCKNENEAKQAAIKIGKPVIVKAQVLVGGRGKAGGIKSASTADEAYDIAKEFLGTTMKGCQVQSVLVDTSEKPRKELYLGFTIDRAKKRVVLLASSQGGINIEEVAKSARPTSSVRKSIRSSDCILTKRVKLQKQ